jgi:hypothetical protein
MMSNSSTDSRPIYTLASINSISGLLSSSGNSGLHSGNAAFSYFVAIALSGSLAGRWDFLLGPYRLEELLLDIRSRGALALGGGSEVCKEVAGVRSERLLGVLRGCDQRKRSYTSQMGSITPARTKCVT